MSKYTDLNDYLKQNEVQEHKKNFQLSHIKDSLDKILGKTIHATNNARKMRLDKLKEDYSDLEHINAGNMTIKGTLYSAIFSGLSIATPFGNSTPLIDLSKENLTSTIDNFKNIATNHPEYSEILKFFSDYFVNVASTDIMVSAFQMTIAAGVIATGAYVKNGLKRNNQIENICKDVDNVVKHKNFSLEHASNVFKVLDSFYDYRLMVAMMGKKTNDFIKDLSAPVLYGIKNNISNPILNKVKDLLGEEFCENVTSKLKNLTPKRVQKWFKKDNPITTNDMLLYIDKKVKESVLSDPTNDPVNLNMQQEISKVAKDVYEAMQLTQTRRALVLSIKEYIDSKKKISELENEIGIKNKLNLRKEKKKVEKHLNLIKDIESLSNLSQKEGRISRFTVLSQVASRSLDRLEQLEAKGFKNTNASLKSISKTINKTIYEEEEDVKKLFLQGNDNKYATDIEKMLMPKTYSFERIFKEKVDEMVESKVNEIEQKKQQASNKFKV